jgi:serine/threonine protein kinase
MHAHTLERADLRERFRLEAKVAGRVESPFLVDVLDAGVSEDGAPFLVMELLRGEDLRRRLGRVGRFAPEEALRYVEQTALALDRVHAAGIVHRDLKPGNLFLEEREHEAPRVKVLDFGVAKLLEGAEPREGTSIAGTPVYMAPEQFRGRAVTGATDVHALGMIAFTFLVGAPYWEVEREQADDVLELALVAVHGPKEPACARAARKGVELPPAFDAWFAGATAPDPSRRFASAGVAARALAETLGLPSRVPEGPDVPRRDPGDYSSRGPPAPTTAPTLPPSGETTRTDSLPLAEPESASEADANVSPGRRGTLGQIDQFLEEHPSLAPYLMMAVLSLVGTIFSALRDATNLYLMAAAWLAAGIAVVAFYYRSIQQAKVGKGWLLALGKRSGATFWRYALEVGESIQCCSVGQLDRGYMSTIREVLGEAPTYMIALTDHERFMVAPYLAARARKFKSYDLVHVHMTDVVLEAPGYWLKLSPFYYLWGPPKTFAVTIVLPDARFRLNSVDHHMIEALRAVPPAPVPALPARAARGKVAFAAGAGALVVVGLVLGGLRAAGVLDGPPPLDPRQAGSPRASPVGKLAGLDNNQIRARIEAAHYQIIKVDERAPSSTWTLAGAGLNFVQMNRLADLRSAEALEQTLLKEPGATFREGTRILYVRMAQPGPARALLAQITR